MAPKPREVTRLLKAVNNGDYEAANRLFPVIYEELRKLASDLMRQERADHTWQRTDLVHEAYVRLSGNKDAQWENRGHFFAAAAKAMRRLLVDHARRRNAAKRGGDQGRPLSLDAELNLAGKLLLPEEPSVDLEALDRALEKIEGDQRHREKGRLVELHFFTGLTLEQTAKVLGKSVASVKRDWTFTKAWLRREMSRNEVQ